MSEVKKHDFILAKRTVIIVAYLLLVCIKTVHAILTSKYDEVIIGYLSVLIMYGILVALIYKGNKIANWIMIVLILVSGVGSAFIGIALVPLDQFVVKSFMTLIGLYFIYGGFRMIAFERTGHNGS